MFKNENLSSTKYKLLGQKGIIGKIKTLITNNQKIKNY
jgi:hypothetical protein